MKLLVVWLTLFTAVVAIAQHRNSKSDPIAKILTAEEVKYNKLADDRAVVSTEITKLQDVVDAKKIARQDSSVEKAKIKMLNDKSNLISKQLGELQSKIEVLRAQGRAKGTPTSNFISGRYTTAAATGKK